MYGCASPIPILYACNVADQISFSFHLIHAMYVAHRERVCVCICIQCLMNAMRTEKKKTEINAIIYTQPEAYINGKCTAFAAFCTFTR